ncbi:HNH endonuclease family protein [Flavobacteriaceae bacterium]|nr:HNH endonuclease family protein [Flavobacteriaceae bacterium]
MPNNDETIVNLEHVLPKKLNDDWSGFDEDEHKLYFKRLGNMTILNSRKNSRIGNKSFTEKTPIYEESEFVITSEIATNPTWTKELINSRQKQLSSDALKCWKMK